MDSDMDVESGSDSDQDWRSKKGKRTRTRTRRTKSFSPQEKPTRVPKDWRRVGESLKKKHKFPVTCGSKEGILHKDRYKKSKPCILSNDRWFTPSEFEKFGGKEKNKKWKISILCSHSKVPLQTFIQEGFLSSALFKTKRVQEQEVAEPVSRTNLIETRSRGNLDENRLTSTVMSELLDDPLTAESFEVRCSTGEGVLHVSRFATETRGKCIRTQDAWFTPRDFLTRYKADGNWRLDIKRHGVPLGELIMKRVLKLHIVNCRCPICTEDPLHVLDQKNDDVCFMCKIDGDLVCCDKCPRAFHHQCHEPALGDDTHSGHWTCCFCQSVKAERNRSS